MLLLRALNDRIFKCGFYPRPNEAQWFLKKGTLCDILGMINLRVLKKMN